MGTTYYERCPHCGKSFYISDIERKRALGNPFVQCQNRKCAEYFYDNKNYEWECLTNEEKKSVMCMLIHTKQSKNSTERVEVFSEKQLKNQIVLNAVGSVLLIGIPALLKNKKLLKIYETFKYDQSFLEYKIISESIKRTSDPEYKKLLLEKGQTFYGIEYKE